MRTRSARQVGALKQLLDEGVIRYAGISRVDNAQIDIAREILGDKLIAVQNQFSPSHPDPEHTMEHCAELGLAHGRRQPRLLLPARGARLGTESLRAVVHHPQRPQSAGNQRFLRRHRTDAHAG